jgi:quinol monooxygenase YgiN
MIIMALRLTVPPEKTADAIMTVNSMIGQMSVKPGCKHFRLYSDTNNDDALMLVEEWESLEALKQHIQSHDFRKILEVMELASRAPEISINTVSYSEGFELIEELRSS